MIGTNLNLDLPTLSDPLATIVSKTVTALSAIQVSIADKATPSALNINSALSMGGNQLTSVGSVTLADGNASAAAGTIYYHLGEFYLIDATGAIQLTASGAINVAGVGGIGGDYGGSNPAQVTYDNASVQYRFMQDGTNWADVKARDFLHTADWEQELGLLGSVNLAAYGYQLSIPGNGFTPVTSGSWSWQSAAIPFLRVGDRVKTIKVVFQDKSAGTFTVTLSKHVGSGSTTVQTWNDTSTGASTITFTVTSPVAVASGEKWIINFSGPGTAGAGTANGDCITDVIVTYDHPA